MARIYVGGITERVSERDLEQEFRRYGKMHFIWVAKKPPGFAFIDFEDARDAEDAVRAWHGNSRGWRVEVSKKSYGARGGSGSGGGSSDRDRGWRGSGGNGYAPSGSSRHVVCDRCGDAGHHGSDCRARSRHRSRSPDRRHHSSPRRHHSPRRRSYSPRTRDLSPRRRQPSRSPRSGRSTHSPSPRQRTDSPPARRSPAAGRHAPWSAAPRHALQSAALRPALQATAIRPALQVAAHHHGEQSVASPPQTEMWTVTRTGKGGAAPTPPQHGREHPSDSQAPRSGHAVLTPGYAQARGHQALGRKDQPHDESRPSRSVQTFRCPLSGRFHQAVFWLG